MCEVSSWTTQLYTTTDHLTLFLAQVLSNNKAFLTLDTIISAQQTGLVLSLIDRLKDGRKGRLNLENRPKNAIAGGEVQ